MCGWKGEGWSGHWEVGTGGQAGRHGCVGKKKKKDLVLVFSNEKKQVSPADRGGGTLGAAGDRAPYVSAHQVRDVPRQRGARAGWVCLPKSLASGCSKELLSFFFSPLLFYLFFFFYGRLRRWV